VDLAILIKTKKNFRGRREKKFNSLLSGLLCKDVQGKGVTTPRREKGKFPGGKKERALWLF